MGFIERTKLMMGDGNDETGLTSAITTLGSKEMLDLVSRLRTYAVMMEIHRVGKRYG